MSALEAEDTSKTIPDQKSTEQTEPHFPFDKIDILENNDWIEFKSYRVKIGNFNKYLSVEAHHFEKVAPGFVFYKCLSSDTYVIVVQTDSMNGNAFVGTISKSAFYDQIPTELKEDVLRCEENVKSEQKTLEAAQQGMWTGKQATRDLGLFDSMTEAGERLAEAGAILGSASERFADAQEELREQKEKVAQIFVSFAENYYSNNPVSSTIQHESRRRRAEEYESPLRRERRRSYSRSRSRSRSKASNRLDDSRARGRHERQRERDIETLGNKQRNELEDKAYRIRDEVDPLRCREHLVQQEEPELMHGLPQ